LVGGKGGIIIYKR